MGTMSCNSNQITYLIGTKAQVFVPFTYRCYILVSNENATPTNMTITF